MRNYIEVLCAITITIIAVGLLVSVVFGVVYLVREFFRDNLLK